MKICSPYWWLSRTKAPPTPFRFSDYVIARYVLIGASPGQTSFPETQPSAEKAFEWLYHLLGLLDAKASALMRLNSVMLAAAAFILNPQYGSWPITKYLIACSAVGSAISITCCLLVVAVDWPFLGLVEKESSTGTVELKFSKELFHRQKVVDFRRRCYVIAWILSLLATVAFLIGIITFFRQVVL